MAAAVDLGSVSTGIRAMFVMLTPNESSFERVEDVPRYVEQVGPTASPRRKGSLSGYEGGSHGERGDQFNQSENCLTAATPKSRNQNLKVSSGEFIS